MTKAAELAKIGEVLTNSQLGGRRNLIINGAMQVAQRGTSSTGSGYSTLDRFAVARGTVTATQSQESLTSSDSPYSLGFRNYFRMTNTGVTASTASYCGIRQTIEAQNIANSGWDYTSSSSYITISFWVRSSLAGTYYLGSKTFDGTEQYYATPITVLANTWTKFTHSISGNSNNTIDTNNEAGFQFYIWMHLGTDYTTSGHTVNQWAAYSSTDQAPDYPQNWNNTGSATFDITGVQLEVGSQATPFEHRSFGEELALCQRYYYKTTTLANAVIAGSATATGTVDFSGFGNFPVRLRATPTALEQSGTASHYRWNGAISIACSSVPSFSTRTTSDMWQVNMGVASGLTVGRSGTVVSDSSGNGYFAWSSEL